MDTRKVKKIFYKGKEIQKVIYQGKTAWKGETRYVWEAKDFRKIDNDIAEVTPNIIFDPKIKSVEIEYDKFDSNCYLKLDLYSFNINYEIIIDSERVEDEGKWKNNKIKFSKKNYPKGVIVEFPKEIDKLRKIYWELKGYYGTVQANDVVICI